MNPPTDAQESLQPSKVGFNGQTQAMNETRYDWLTDRWVIFAPNRDERPDQFKRILREKPAGSVQCPFCYGSEHETPDPTLILPETESDNTTSNRRSHQSKPNPTAWRVRVVPNKFPAVSHNFQDHDISCSETAKYERPLFDLSHLNSASHSMPNFGRHPLESNQLIRESQTATAGAGSEQIFRRGRPSGAHEVIIESPEHVDSITALSLENVELVFEAYRRRLLHWRAQRHLKYAVVFKNFGSDAGASLFHSHSQLISLDFVPSDIVRLQSRLSQYLQQFGQCYLCQLIAEEEERQERVMLSTEHFIAICPFASRFPFSFTIVPRSHRGSFEEITANELSDLALTAKRTLSALESARPSAAYNFVLQTVPFQGAEAASSHWRLRVIPRLSKVAGFEWGSDCFINTVTPEHAAQVLRQHLD
jgi:UDPglucose--hexose-1-phosphate uridylyltransferase